jgi:hypothetical protein
MDNIISTNKPRGAARAKSQPVKTVATSEPVDDGRPKIVACNGCSKELEAVKAVWTLHKVFVPYCRDCIDRLDVSEANEDNITKAA